jgi:hypothetical protein
MKRMPWRTLALFLSLSPLVAVSACDPDDDSGSDSGADADADADADSDTDTDTDTDGDTDTSSSCEGALLAGTWLSANYSVRFAGDLSYEAAGAPNLEEIDVTGQAAVDGCQISLTDLVGTYACPEDQVGVYAFAVTDTTLTFALVSDDCLGRSTPLDGDVLTRGE